MTLAEVISWDYPMRYMVLDRMRSDCRYYLGYGGRMNKYLWSGNPEDQIRDMLTIYDAFPDRDKPEWITRADIVTYGREMGVNTNKLLKEAWFARKAAVLNLN